MIFRVKYDNGSALDAMPYDSINDALAAIRKSIQGGVHTTATITCIPDEGPDRILDWEEVQRHL